MTDLLTGRIVDIEIGRAVKQIRYTKENVIPGFLYYPSCDRITNDIGRILDRAEERVRDGRNSPAEASALCESVRKTGYEAWRMYVFYRPDLKYNPKLAEQFETIDKFFEVSQNNIT